MDLYTGLEEHWQRMKMKRWELNYGFDLQRYEFLKNKLEKIDEELAKAELQRFD